MARSPLLASLLLLAAVPACGGDDSPLPIDPPNVVEESVLRARLDAWKQSVTKDCDIDAIFGDGPSDDPHVDLDAALVLAKLKGHLSVTDGGETLILNPPPRPTHSGFGGRSITVAHDGKQLRDTEIGTTLSEGICTVDFDGKEEFRGRVWPSLPVLAHVKPSTVGATSQPATVVLYAPDGATTGAAYVGLPQLEVVNDALKGDAERATALLSRLLGVPAKDLIPLVTVAPPWFDSVESDAATAPFPLYVRVNGNVPLFGWEEPVVPIDVAHVEDWAPKTSAIRTLHIRFPRAALDVEGSADRADRPLELAVRLSLETSAGKLTARIVDVAAPVAANGGDALAIDCFHRAAKAALGYVARPSTQLGSIPVVPGALNTGYGPAVQSGWFDLPCGALTGDLGAAIRADATSIGQLGSLLERSSYVGPKRALGISPRGWDAWLGHAVTTDAELAPIVAASGPYPTLAASARTQRAMFADHRYAETPAAAQPSRRALLWSLSFQCGGELSAAQLDKAMDVPGDKIDGLLSTLYECPWTP